MNKQQKSDNNFDLDMRFDYANANFNKEIYKDLNKLENRLVIFCLLDNKFYKLAFLDQRSLRFEAWGERMTRIIPFKSGVLFDYANEIEFEGYYQKYIDNFKAEREIPQPRSKEYLIEWFEEYEGRPNLMKEYRNRNRNTEK